MNYDDAAFSDTTHVVYNNMPLSYIFHFGTFRTSCELAVLTY